MRGTLGFSVLAIFKSVFRFFGFGIHYGLRIFLLFSILFRFSREILTGFRI